MTCLCEDCIARPSDLCPVHGSIPLDGDRMNWFWLDNDRDPDASASRCEWCWPAALVFVALIVSIAAAVLAPFKWIGGVLHKDKRNG